MYTIITGTLESFLYEKGFILTAGIDYDCYTDSVNKHITNLSINKKIEGYPGQIPVNVCKEYPEVYICIFVCLFLCVYVRVFLY